MMRLAATFVLMLCAFSVFAVSPAEALNNCKKKIETARSLTADFAMTVNGQKINGKLLSKGAKFAIISNAVSNWYNGKDLYTYSSASNETTVFCPSASELAEVNPLLYLKSVSEYKVSTTKAKKAGIETVVLIPKRSGTGVKSITLELDSKTYLPKTISIIPSSGAKIMVSLSGVKLNAPVDDSSFSYPKSKYPKVQIIDLR